MMAENNLERMLISLPEEEFTKLKPLSEKEIREALNKYCGILHKDYQTSCIESDIFYR